MYATNMLIADSCIVVSPSRTHFARKPPVSVHMHEV